MMDEDSEDCPKDRLLAGMIADFSSLQMRDLLSDKPLVVSSSLVVESVEPVHKRARVQKTLSEEDWRAAASF